LSKKHLAADNSLSCIICVLSMNAHSVCKNSKLV
jgi:hypothetical protein